MDHLELGCGGNKCAVILVVFELCEFSRLNSRGAAYDENNFQVEEKTASLVVKARINGEMYVLNLDFVFHFVILVIIGFEVEK